MGWEAKPMEKSHRHAHVTWVSPSGNTAYGIIHFALPFPVPASWVVGPFLDEMKIAEGESRLVGQVYEDPQLGGVRFVAEGSKHKTRVNLLTSGFRGWAIYVGTNRGGEEVPQEMRLAEMARERTITGPNGSAGRFWKKFLGRSKEGSE